MNVVLRALVVSWVFAGAWGCDDGEGEASSPVCDECTPLLEIGGCTAAFDRCLESAGPVPSCGEDYGRCVRDTYAVGAICYRSCGDEATAAYLECSGACTYEQGQCRGDAIRDGNECAARCADDCPDVTCYESCMDGCEAVFNAAWAACGDTWETCNASCG